MTWAQFKAAVEADGITDTTVLRSVVWTATLPLVVQTLGVVSTTEEFAPVEMIHTRQDDLGQVEITQ